MKVADPEKAVSIMIPEEQATTSTNGGGYEQGALTTTTTTTEDAEGSTGWRKHLCYDFQGSTKAKGFAFVSFFIQSKQSIVSWRIHFFEV